MKRFLLLMVITAFYQSCSKEHTTKQIDNASLGFHIIAVLQDSMLPATFEKLDFKRIVHTRIGDGNESYIRVPFAQKSMTSQFVLIQLNDSRFTSGRIIQIEQGNTNTAYLTGTFKSCSLNEKVKNVGTIQSGNIVYQNIGFSAYRQPDIVPAKSPFEWLPEVVIMSRYQSGNGFSNSMWYSLHSMWHSGVAGTTGEGSSAYFSLAEPVLWNGSGGNTSTGGGTYEDTDLESPRHYMIFDDDAVLIDFEADVYNPEIDIMSYLKCFDDLPDVGATYAITLFADIPVDGDPSRFFNWQTGSPGHVFVQLSKANGQKAIVQNFGYYPRQGWKVALTFAPVSGKFVDNGGHEYNASIRMPLKQNQFKELINYTIETSKYIKYDIDENNCADVALAMFNYNRKVPLEVTRYDILGGYAQKGSNTPQGVYELLVNMRNQSHSEAVNITIPKSKKFASKSYGPCK